MEEHDKDMEIFIKKYNDKINNLSTIQKILVILFLLLIGVGAYLFMSGDVTQVFTYTVDGIDVCNETYINGIVQGEYCQQNTHIYTGDKWQNFKIDYDASALNWNQS